MRQVLITSISLPGASGSFFVRSVFTCWACVAVANPKVKINTERISFFMLCIASVLSVMCCDNRLNRSCVTDTPQGSCGNLFERLFDGTDVFVGITVLRSTIFSVRRVCFQFIKIERACIGVQPLPQSVAFNRALGRQLASERFDQPLIRPQKPRGQLVPAMRKGISVCHCFGDTPIDRSLPRVKRTRHVGYELFPQLIRNRITDCLVHDRSDVDEGEGSA